MVKLGLQVYEVAEAIAALTCIVCFVIQRRFLNTWLLPVLMLTVLVETIPIRFFSLQNRYLTLNLFTLFECISFTLLLRQLYVSEKWRKWVLAGCAGLLLFGLINLFFIQGPFVLNLYTRKLNCLLITVTSLTVFWRFAIGSKTTPGIPMNAALCVTSGVLLFYCGMFILFTVMGWLQVKYPHDSRVLYVAINYNLNLVLYGLITAGLLVEAIGGRKKSLAIGQ